AQRGRRPRAAARTGHTIRVQPLANRFDASPAAVLGEDPADDGRLHLIDHRDRVTARLVAATLQLVAVAAPTGNAAHAHALPEGLARAAPDRLQLHLMADALDHHAGCVQDGRVA